MMIEIDVPPDYYPQVYAYGRAFKKGTRWYLKYKLPNGISHCQKMSMKKPGKVIIDKKQSDLARGLFTQKEVKKLGSLLKQGNLTIDEAIKTYQELRPLDKWKSPNTLEKEKTTIPKCFSFFKKNLGLEFIHEVGKSEVHQYRDFLLKQVKAEELRPTTAQTNLATVKKVFKWLKRRDQILVNPTLEIDPIEVRKQDAVKTRTPSDESIRKILTTPYHSSRSLDLKKLTLFAFYTGARIGEILHLEWDDIQDGIWHIRNKPHCPTKFGLGWAPKWDNGRLVPLHSTALDLLKSIPKVSSVGYFKNDTTPYPANFVFVVKDHNPRNPTGWRRINSIRRAWRTFLESAGIPKDEIDYFTAHDFRRKWNNDSKYQSGLDENTRSKILGQRPEVNRRHYEGVSENNVLRMLAENHPSNNPELLKNIA